MAKVSTITSEADLNVHEAQIDLAVCGVDLSLDRETHYGDQGAHDATPTHYFVLEDLFRYLSFDDHSHLLDVGCSTGRVLAYFLRERLPGRATGVELDPELAAVAKAWTAGHHNLQVIQGSVLDLDLADYTAFYLFNPFSASVLQRFIEAIEADCTRPATVIHMSDNGDTWHYVGRPGWTELASGSFQHLRNERGRNVAIYENPQHYTVWRYEPSV